jgi:hypothetical protein
MDLGRIAAVIFDQKRPLLAALTSGGKVQVWDWERRVLVREFAGLAGSQQALPLHFTGDGLKLAVVLTSNPELFAYREWEIATGREMRSFDFSLARSFRTTGGPFAGRNQVCQLHLSVRRGSDL